MSEKKAPSVSWFFLVKWILANTLGWGLGWEVSWVMGFLISLAAAYVMTGSSTDEIGSGSGWIFIITTWGLIGGIYGAIIGTMQWLVLRRYLAHSGWWVLATAGSLALLFVVDVTIMISVSGTLNQATFGKIIEGSWPNGLFFVILWPIISFFTWSDNFIPLIYPFSMVICGVVIGVMQWLVLQRQVPLAGIWVLVVAISFLVSYALEKAVGLTSWYVFGLGTGLMTGLCLVLLLSASRSAITEVNVGSK